MKIVVVGGTGLIGSKLVRNLKKLGHEVIATCTPPINYATGATHQVINQVQSLRNSGIECYFTTHAGPQVQIISLASDLEEIMAKLQELEGVLRLIASQAGSGAYENYIVLDEKTDNYEKLKRSSKLIE